jgi:lipopolysaccharide/colanic/teichoic acid biosynthesis glycosyltransferase
MSLTRNTTTSAMGRKPWTGWSRTTTTIWSAIWPPHRSGITGASPRDDRQLAMLSPLETCIRAEQARVDRFGTHFCVVTFTPAEERRNPQQDPRQDPQQDPQRGGSTGNVAGVILDTLVRRVRMTDVLGGFGPAGMGVVLPLTDPEGANILALDVVEMLRSRGYEISFRIYSHPVLPITGSSSGPLSQHPQAPGRDTGAAPDATSSTALPRVAPIAELFIQVRQPRWKRLLDIVGSAAGLVCLTPFFLLIAAYIKIVSPGPVFFRQSRIGFRGTSFRIWKLRTMHVNADTSTHQQHVLSLISGEGSSDRPMQKLDGADSRIIKGGLFLRRSSIDELPQLINVLLGDMSLVGPRPEMPYAFDAYQPWQARRFDVLPGMTGLWQVSGKNRTTFREMIRLDISYGRSLSPLRDATILVRTVPVVLFARNGTEDAAAAPAARATRTAAVTWDGTTRPIPAQFARTYRWTPSPQNISMRGNNGGNRVDVSPLPQPPTAATQRVAT